jgi:hypothetical protein
MKPEPKKQSAMHPANGQEDPQLWELLGRGTHAAAPDDFLGKVLSQVDELQAVGATRGGRGRQSLAERWDQLVDSFFGPGSYSGLRLAGALAVLTIICGLATWPMIAPRTDGPASPEVATSESRGGEEESDFTILADASGFPNRAPRDRKVFQEAVMHTILGLDDYLAFADQQAFLDTDSIGYLH